jgi:nucleotide-binding universal stress UspA family protein
VSHGPVLCAFDASEPSLLAARVACWLAGALNAPLELVYVVDHDELPALPRSGERIDPHTRSALYEIQDRIADQQARADIEEMVAALPHTDVTGSVLGGEPAPVIRQRAVDCGAALLVSGTAARRGLEHVLHGSISGALAGEAPCPLVVVASDDAVSEPGPVLVGDDGSEHALRAVRHAESLAARLDRDLVRLHIEDGDAVEGLVRAAHEQRACVVVTGTRGRGPLRGELLGSVSTGLVRDAGRPVMLISAHAEAPT